MRSRSEPPADRDTWRTPAWLAELVTRHAGRHGIELDPCGHVDQHVPAQRIAVRATPDEIRTHARLIPSRYVSVACGLEYMRANPARGVVWCNPPYSDPGPWIEALDELGATALVLTNTATATRWYQRALRACDSALLFRQRIAFEGRSGAVKGNRYDQTLFRLGTWRCPWPEDLASLGTVIVPVADRVPAHGRKLAALARAYPSQPHGPADSTPARDPDPDPRQLALVRELDELARQPEAW